MAPPQGSQASQESFGRMYLGRAHSVNQPQSQLSGGLHRSMQGLTLDATNVDMYSMQEGMWDVRQSGRASRLPKRLALDLSQPSFSQQQDPLGFSPEDLTPQEQQFHIDYDATNSLMEQCDGRSPVMSPQRLKQKRPRNRPYMLTRAEDESLSQASQSQSRSCGDNAGCSRAAGGPTARPPLPRSREPALPTMRNAFTDPAGEGATGYLQGQPSFSRQATHFRFASEYAASSSALGHGNFSIVYKAVQKVSGMVYAIKTNREPILTNPTRNSWVNEIQALAAVQTHANIVQYHDAWFEPDMRSLPTVDSSLGGGSLAAYGECVFIKLELCGSSLGSLVKARTPVSEAELRNVLRQMASALKHMHERNILHLDVKPDNIYMGRDGKYKLGDFGLAVPKGGQRVGSSEGDCKYLAPECLRGGFLTGPYAERVDVFALGASLVELASGNELASGGQPYQRLRSGHMPLLPHVRMGMQNLLKRMLLADPSQRPSADEVLKAELDLDKDKKRPLTLVPTQASSQQARGATPRG